MCKLALQSSTLAASVAVGNTISTLAPQLAGAIDIVVVEQPDGSLRSSPFYGAAQRPFLGIVRLIVAAGPVNHLATTWVCRL